MKSERLLQITSALCVAMGTILLGMGEHDLRMAVLAIFGAMLAVWLTDVLGIFRLNRWVASVIAFVASLIAFRKAFPLNSVSSIIEITNLLVYLELILLFQKKNHRVYWQLLVLSLLQVVVSTLLTQGAQFGLMMIIYMFVAILDLALLNLYTESLRASGRFPEAKSSPSEKENVETALRPRVRISVRRDLFRQIFRMGIATLFLTALVFFMLPRFGRPAWRSNLFAGPQSVGFTDHIELGQLGATINDATEVLRIKFIDPQNPVNNPVKGEIYLHGIPLTRYSDRKWYQTQDSQRLSFHNLFSFSHHSRFSRYGMRNSSRYGGYRGYYPGNYRGNNQGNARWNNRGNNRGNDRGNYGGYRGRPRSNWQSFFPDLYREDYYQSSEMYLNPQIEEFPADTLMQEVVIEPFNHRELFGVRPFFVKQLSSQISYDTQNERLMRDASLCRKRFSYRLYTTGISHQNQRYYYPAERKMDLNSLLEYPTNIPTVIQTANQWVEESHLSGENPFSKAMYLSKRLSDPEAFSYNLHSRRSDFDIDPIEDFIKNNPEGHCEFFATTLAMMLRSQGIPCRLIVGFKSDEYNTLGKFYRVRQLHAHTWVEALFRAEELGVHNPDDDSMQNGIWYRFDPTPIDNGPPSEAAKLLTPLANLMDWFDTAWENYVMEMDRSRQDSAIYKPIINWLKNLYEKMTDSQWWIDVWEKNRPMLHPRNWNVEKWISWRGGLIGVAIMLTMLVVFRSCRWVYRIITRRFRKIRAENERRRRIEVEFYRRFVHMAARLGLTRQPGETPREFASSAGPQIAKVAKNAELEHLPSLITEAYYQVRFGRSPLDKDRQEKIELAVGHLEAVVKKS